MALDLKALLRKKASSETKPAKTAAPAATAPGEPREPEYRVVAQPEEHEVGVGIEDRIGPEDLELCVVRQLEQGRDVAHVVLEQVGQIEMAHAIQEIPVIPPEEIEIGLPEDERYADEEGQDGPFGRSDRSVGGRGEFHQVRLLKSPCEKCFSMRQYSRMKK